MLSPFTLSSTIPWALNLKKENLELTLLESWAVFFFFWQIWLKHLKGSYEFSMPLTPCLLLIAQVHNPERMLGDKQYWEKNKTKQKKPHTPLSSLLSLLQLCPQLIKKSFLLTLALKNKIKYGDYNYFAHPLCQICLDFILPLFFFFVVNFSESVRPTKW